MADDTIVEEWRPVEGWRAYEVSNLGRIKRTGRGKAARVGLILKHSFSVGYPSVSLSERNVQKTIRIHTLVCRAFHGPAPTPLHEVAHWDGDYLNCHLANLRWATHQENAGDTRRHGRLPQGSRNGFSKLTEQDIKIIRQKLHSGEHVASIGAGFLVDRRTIARIRDGKIWAWLK